MNVIVSIILCLSDNYAYLVSWGDKAVVIDAPEAAPIQKVLREKNLQLEAILLTHHHWDHIGGIEELVRTTGCQVIGPDDQRIPALTQKVHEGEILRFGPLEFQVIATPGHTQSHIVFYEKNLESLFTGDTLFGAGCGRLFEGTPEQMFHSLQKIQQLPDATKIYCGHEYTEHNLQFALQMEPHNRDIQNYLKEIQALRKRNKPTVPSTLAIEKKVNPFLRTSNPENGDLFNFTNTRSLRNNF